MRSISIPSGYKFSHLGSPKKGEWYLSEGEYFESDPWASQASADHHPTRIAIILIKCPECTDKPETITPCRCGA